MRRLGIALAILSAAAVARADVATVRVSIYSRSRMPHVTIRAPEGGAFLVNGSTVTGALRFEPYGRWVRWKHGTKTVTEKRFTVQPLDGFFRVVPPAPFRNRTYEGELILSTTRGDLLLVNQLPREHYVASVLAAEVPDMQSPEALKAMAVVIRGYLIGETSRHPHEPFDLCDLQHCQVYPGYVPHRPELHDAAEATAAQVLMHDGHAIPTYYHAVCGGRTESAAAAWRLHPVSYLTSVDDRDAPGGDAYCAWADGFHWKSTLSAGQLQSVARAEKWFRKDDPIVSVDVVERSDAGRAALVRLHTRRGVRTIPGSLFVRGVGKKYGWRKLRSTWFDIKPVKRKRGVSFVFEGAGYGHGVGLCQAGAEGMGRRGYDYKAILLHYYPGTTLGFLDPAS